MRTAPQQSSSNLGKLDFDSSVVEAAWTYHQQIGGSRAKGKVPVEVAAFIAGAAGAHTCSLQRKKNDCVINENPKIMKRLLFLFASIARELRDHLSGWGSVRSVLGLGDDRRSCRGLKPRRNGTDCW